MNRPLLAVLALALVACTGSETGNPPLDPGVLVDRLAIPPSGGPGHPTTIVGSAGSVTAETTRVLVTPLDSTNEIVVAVPDSDGSFSVSIDGPTTQRIRIQLDEGSERRPPLDLTFEGNRLSRTLDASDDCLTMPLELLAANTSQSLSVHVQNQCDRSIEFLAPRSRLGLLVSSENMFSIAAGASHDVTIFAAAEEDVLYIGEDEATLTRRAVTVRLRSP